MKQVMLIGLTLVGLSACVPARQGSLTTLPFDLGERQVLPVTAGVRWYAQATYDQAHYRARAVLLQNGELVDRTVSRLSGPDNAGFGVDPADSLESIHPFRNCNATPLGELAGRFSVRVAEAPPGWSPGLFSAAFILRCGERAQRPLPGPLTNDPNQPVAVVTVDFTLALRLLYVVDIPSGIQPGSYPVQLEVTLYPSGRSITQSLTFQVEPSR